MISAGQSRSSNRRRRVDRPLPRVNCQQTDNLSCLSMGEAWTLRPRGIFETDARKRRMDTFPLDDGRRRLVSQQGGEIVRMFAYS